jgi:hypothetical protein
MPTANNIVRSRFAMNLGRLGVIKRVDLIQAKSPDVLPSIAPKRGWDFVFLDGWHFDGQPSRDVTGLLPHLSKNAVLWLHDCWMGDIKNAMLILEENGYHASHFVTSNRLTAFWKQEPVWWDAFWREA